MVDCIIERELTGRYFTGLPLLIVVALLVCFAADQLEQRILIGHFAFRVAECADVVHRVSAAFDHLHDRGDMGHVSSFPTLSNEKAMRILPFRIARRFIVRFSFQLFSETVLVDHGITADLLNDLFYNIRNDGNADGIIRTQTLRVRSGVAGTLVKIKPELTRRLFVSQYAYPVRIIPNAEVARMYKEYLDGTDIAVPWNVVTPDLRRELVKAGVQIDYSDVY